MKRKIRCLKKQVVLSLKIVLLVILIALVFLISNLNLKFLFAKSINENALSYHNQEVLVFYPDCTNGKTVAKEVAKAYHDQTIVDYSLTKCGAYYQVLYPNGTLYYLDENNNELVITSFNEDSKYIIADCLRYQMKSQEIAEAYTLDFLIDTYYKNIDLSDTYNYFKGEDLVIHFSKYDFDCQIPLKYLQNCLGIDLGFVSQEYGRQHYVSKTRKCLCLTFDDGPYLKNSSQIVDELFKYDSSATFFVVGSRLNDTTLVFCKEAINKGMEYGSHTENHKNLKKLNLEKVYEEVYAPYEKLLTVNDYQIKLYRPPYGSRNLDFESVTDLTAILWNVDSLDWDLRKKYDEETCVKQIVNKVINETNENDIILFHDLYDTTVEAIIELLPYFINEGYQIISVSELMANLDINEVNCFSGR